MNKQDFIEQYKRESETVQQAAAEVKKPKKTSRPKSKAEFTPGYKRINNWIAALFIIPIIILGVVYFGSFYAQDMIGNETLGALYEFADVIPKEGLPQETQYAIFMAQVVEYRPVILTAIFVNVLIIVLILVLASFIRNRKEERTKNNE